MIPVTHRSKWVMIRPDNIIENGYVTTFHGQIVEFGRGKCHEGTRQVEHGSGVLMPPLVNAHTHLDLTVLNNLIPLGNGFISWIKEVIRCKSLLDEDKIESGILTGLKMLENSGCILAGDHRSFDLWPNAESRTEVLVFREYLGTQIPEQFHDGSSVLCSLAAHAPHTASPALIQNLKKMCRRRKSVFSIHAAESPEEWEFITKATGPWSELLASRDIIFSNWELTSRSPLFHLEKLGVLDENTITVHLLQVDDADLELLARRRVRACLCPRSNLNLTGQLPDIPAMLQKGIFPALGTDSLASVRSLNLFDEMTFVGDRFPGIHPGAILAMGTLNGAKALGWERELGTLETGKYAVQLFIHLEARSSEEVLEKILFGQSRSDPEWVW